MPYEEEVAVVAKDLGSQLGEVVGQGSLLVAGQEERVLEALAEEKEVGDADGLGCPCPVTVICCTLGAQIVLCGFDFDFDSGCNWDCVVVLQCDRYRDYMTGFGCRKDFDP